MRSMDKYWTGNHRAPWHDYTSRCIYHITIRKRSDIADFGHITGDYRLRPGLPGSPYLEASAIETAVKKCIREISTIHPALRVYQYALMPDHLHLILSVEDSIDEILGRKIAAFKVRVNECAQVGSIFEKGFNDQIIFGRDLDDLYVYLRTNAYRLAVRLAHPEYFSRVNSIEINGRMYSAYGNLQLLSNPFKEQVVIHRKDDSQKREQNRERWLHCAANGGVLVSPFISPTEKNIRNETEEMGGKIILFRYKGFGERGKPEKHDFDLCEEGRLLILTPLDSDFPCDFGREACIRMNEHAAHVASYRRPRR